jgi:hypothetical protein
MQKRSKLISSLDYLQILQTKHQQTQHNIYR